jgi:flagellar motor protein MotB
MSNEKKWFLRKSDGVEYGPVSLAELRRWSVESRVLAGNEISGDQKRWHLIEELQDLDMNWVARRPDGLEYGPFNIRATTELHRHDVLPKGTTFRHKSTGETHTLEEVLQELGTPLASKDGPDEAAPQETTPEDEMPHLNDELLDSDAESERTEPSSERIDALVAELDRVTVELDAVQTQLTDQATQLSAAETTKTDAIATAVAAARSEESKQLETAVQALTAERDGAVTDAQAQQDELEATRQKASADQAAATTQLKTLQEQLDQDRSALARAEDLHTTALRELSERNDALTHQLSELPKQHQEEIGAVRDELTSWQERGTTFEARLATIEGEQEEAEALQLQTTTELRHQVIFMKKNSANLKGDLEQTRTRLHNLRLTVITVLGLTAVAVMLTVLFNNSGCRTPPGETEVATGGEPNAGAVSTTDPGAEATGEVPTAASSGNLDLPPAPHSTGESGGLAGSVSLEWPTIAVAGVRTIPERGTLKLVFADGLFTSWDNLGTDAKKNLQEISRLLSPLADGYRLEVEGHTDNQPLRSTERYADNIALGKARAKAVAAFLTTEGGLPASMITSTSAGANRPPHPNTSPDSRRRNRTVVLILRRGR